MKKGQKIFMSVLEMGRGRNLMIIGNVFALLYHISLLTMFYSLGVMPMFYFNIFSVTLFLALTIITPKAEGFRLIYSLGLFEVITHQIMGIYYLGGETAFYFLIIPMGFLIILIENHNFGMVLLYGFFSSCIFMALAINSTHFTGRYDVSDGVILVIRCINIFFGIFLLFFEIMVFTFRLTNVGDNLEIQVKEKTRELEIKNKKVYELQNHMINSLASLVENRDSDTGEHIMRTSAYVELILVKAYDSGIYKDVINEEYMELVKRAAPMHDVGKIVVSDNILKKPGKLTQEEFELMKCHTTEGSRIVREIMSEAEDKKYIDIAAEVAEYHHERWDGKGYPEGLEYNEIPVCARIMAIADVFDALVSVRCYKEAIPVQKALDIIREESGTHFDPVLAELFLSMESEIKKICRS